MICIDLGVDYRDEDLVAIRQAMCIEEFELFRGILSAVDRLLLVLRQGENVIGLEARDLRLGDADVPAHLRYRGAIVDAPDVQRSPGETNEAGLQSRHAVTRSNLVEHLRRYACGNIENESIILEARHARRRQVAGAAQRRALNGGSGERRTAAPCTGAATSTTACTTTTWCKLHVRWSHAVRRIRSRRRGWCRNRRSPIE